MLPMNLLALDSASFDTGLKAGQGVQPAKTGFSATFGNLMQAPETDRMPLATFPVGSGTLTSWSGPGGAVLPQAGKSLPPSDPVALPEMEQAAVDILENPEALHGLAPTANSASGASPAIPGVQTRSPMDTARPPPATAPHQAGVATETPGPANAAHSSVLQHIRSLTPGADASAPLPGNTGAADTLQRSDAESRLQSISVAPQVTTRVQEFAQQVTDAARASSALTPESAEALLRGDAQDLKAAPPSASVLLPLASFNAPPAANVAPSPAAPMQWSGSSIDIAPGQPGWNEALGDRVIWMAGNRIQNAELRLNPAELGPLRVQISMDDGNATVTFTAHHPLTRDAIEQALPKLREMLADQGVALQNASVNDQGPRHQQAGPGGEDTPPQFVSAHDADASGIVDGESAVPVTRAPLGLVDVFA